MKSKKLILATMIAGLFATSHASFVAVVANKPVSYLIGGNEGGGNPLPPVSSCDPALSVTRAQLDVMVDALDSAALEAANVSCVEDFSELFKSVNASGFNPDISGWDVSSGVNFSGMFTSITSTFKPNLTEWNVSKGTDFSKMFWLAMYFEGDLSKWDVSSGENFSEMFRSVFFFNSVLRDWDVSKGTNFNRMFAETRFNNDIGKWNVL